MGVVKEIMDPLMGGGVIKHSLPVVAKNNITINKITFVKLLGTTSSFSN